MYRSKAGLVVLALAVAAFAGVNAAGAAGNHDLVAGHADQTLTPDQTGGFAEHDQYSVGATSDPDGSNPNGSIEYSSDAPGLPQQHFHGDVSQGCVLVSGNHAAVVGKLPPSEQFTASNGRLIDYVAVVVEDNGSPDMGQPTDQAVAFLAFDTTGQHVCAGAFSPSVLPFDHGNFVVQDAS